MMKKPKQVRPIQVQPKQAQVRQGSVYIAVSGTAMLVSLIGFSALHLSRLELRNTTAHNDRAYARQFAYSSVEFALSKVDFDSSWRTNYSHGVENSINTSGVDEDLVFKFLDHADSNLANDATEPVEIQGIGRYGGATFIYSVTYAASLTSNDQVVLQNIHSYTAGTNTNSNVSSSTYSGQYFVPNLPPGAITWEVTDIDIYLKSNGSNDSILNLRFYNSDAGGLPDTVIDSVSIDETLLPSGSYGWYKVVFSNLSGLAPGGGFCLAFEGADNNFAAIVPYFSGITLTDSHKLNGGNGAWYTPEPNNSIQYRINGVYTTSSGSGAFTVTPGSWRATAAP